MDNLHYMKNHLKFLGERINAVASNILFVATKKKFGDEAEYVLVKQPDDGQPSKVNTIECHFIDKGLWLNVVGADGESVLETLISKKSLPSDFPTDIESLMQDPKKHLPIILERKPNLIDRGDEITSSHLIDSITEICNEEVCLQPILEKMRNPDNW